MKKTVLFLFTAITTLYVNAQTPIFQFDLKSFDEEMCHKINDGYAITTDKTADIIYQDGKSENKIQCYNLNTHGMVSKIATNGKFNVSVFYDTYNYQVNCFDENGKFLSKAKIDGNLKLFPKNVKVFTPKGKTEESRAHYRIRNTYILDDKIIIEFAQRVESIDDSWFSTGEYYANSAFLIADLNSTALNFKRIDLKYPLSKIAAQPDFNFGWKFIKYQNKQLYFYRTLLSEPNKNLGKMSYEILSFDLDGNPIGGFNTTLTTDKETEMKYDAGCYIPSFDSNHVYLVRNFEFHGETETVLMGNNYSGRGKQKAGFEVTKCNLSDGKVEWSNYIDYIDDNKNKLSGFSGKLIYQMYPADFPLEISFEFDKISICKWAFNSRDRNHSLGSGSNIKQITIFNTDGKTLINKVVTESKKDEERKYLTKFQDEDIKDQPFYASLKKIKTDPKKKVIDVVYFNNENNYVVVFDEKNKKCLIYK